MKKYTIYLSGILLFLSIQSTAQSQQRNYPHKQRSKSTRQRSSPSNDCAKAYIGFSTGINNSVGLIGLHADVPIISALSVNAGIGRSTWGWKSYVEGRVYFSPCNQGWAIGAGVTHSNGLMNFVTELPTVGGDRQVTLNLQRKINVMVSAYRFWNLGHRDNRFYLQLGWSIDTEPTVITRVDSGPELTETGRQTMETLAPGGLIIAVGFSFALPHH